MNEHNLYYYPYASLTDNQVPLLKAAALYFDKLYILDPFQASWKFIGAGHVASDIKLLKDKKILEPLDPKKILHEYEQPITEAINKDLNDPEFIRICETYSQKERWTLALAKVPKEIRKNHEHQPIDRAMQKLMGDFAREKSKEIFGRNKEYDDYQEYSELGDFYDEYREGEFGAEIDYRYADFPMALGEAIMINHALFTGLLHSNATPLTDDPFHNRILNYKIKRAYESPEIRMEMEERYRQLQVKQDLFAHDLMRDRKINLPALTPKFSLEEILKYRDDHEAELQAARQRLSQLSRQIKEMPLSKDFPKEVDAALGAVDKELQDLRRARDAWLKSDRGKSAMKASGLVIGAATAAIGLATSTVPFISVPMLGAALGFVSGSAIPGIEFFRDSKDKKKAYQENGLHYFIDIEVRN